MRGWLLDRVLAISEDVINPCCVLMPQWVRKGPHAVRDEMLA